MFIVSAAKCFVYIAIPVEFGHAIPDAQISQMSESYLKVIIFCFQLLESVTKMKLNGIFNLIRI